VAGEQITERGIGNGMSLLIFTGIVVACPRHRRHSIRRPARPPGVFTAPAILLLLVLMIAVVAFIVYVERRRAPYSRAICQACPSDAK